MNQTIKSGFAFKAALVCLATGAGASAWAETPLGLMISETLTYDTNVLKNDSDKQSDTVSATGVKVFFDKQYGRQRYNASALGIAQRYKTRSDYDNDGYQIELGLNSEFGANGLVSVNHSRSQTLQDLSDQGLNRRKEIVKVQSTDVNARYGLYGRWGVSGALNDDEISYEQNDQQDQKIFGTRVGLRYNPSDLLYFDVGVKKTKSELTKYPTVFGVGDEVDRTDYNVITGWTVTGYSRLSAQVGLTRERYDKDAARDFNGWTGRATWQYTPRGKVSYSLAFSRDTNNAGGYTILPGSEARDLRNVQQRLTTGLQGSATWQATSKISASAALVLRRIEEEQANLIQGDRKGTGNYRSASMGLRYEATRALSFDCSLSSYKRTETPLAIGYSGESLACTAAFLID